MDFLQAEITAKRKQMTSGDPETQVKKYQKRGDLDKIRACKYLEEQDRLRLEKEEKARIKMEEAKDREARQAELKATMQKRNNRKENLPEEKSESASKYSPEEVTSHLRSRGEPIRLFGETEEDRFKRLRLIELRDLRQSKKDQEAVISPDELQVDLFDLKLDPLKVYRQLLAYYKTVIHEWEDYIEDRPEEQKQSNKGKIAYKYMKESIEHLRPLIRLFEGKILQPEVLERIAEIVFHSQRRDYLRANDQYLKLSIGHAANPIGIAIAGIKEKSPREKIQSKSTKTLNNEETRKWLQGIKRLLTFVQTKYPPNNKSQAMG
ncbi:Pre-mRNA-splicing factor 18 [Neolecta irregularis DAH-3]|uniref:Pre-mRNA-splicing factor 18 n=1 Tax=Neolecta irregularis (strain DAH-3) TaxID=1198029 RepID=A0A1U7LQ01_NEOID|nr:Pre-mRNA-splicing factor 18 [Neolecta irregularis DAH-3]|eukprot:OLL24750.1 Pre-mRNA-splicing factor 18 [Neolecta irregularis DAH-3]